MISILQSKLSIIGGWMSGRLLLVSLEVALFALVVWVVLRFAHFRSARVRGAIWLTVLLKMVFSLFVAFPVSFSLIPNQEIAKQLGYRCNGYYSKLPVTCQANSSPT